MHSSTRMYVNVCCTYPYTHPLILVIILKSWNYVFKTRFHNLTNVRHTPYTLLYVIIHTHWKIRYFFSVSSQKDIFYPIRRFLHKMEWVLEGEIFVLFLVPCVMHVSARLGRVFYPITRFYIKWNKFWWVKFLFYFWYHVPCMYLLG